MTRRAIFTIISLMSVALIGLIGFQIYWINNAIILSQERFQKDVQESLRNVSERLERNELLFVASNSFVTADVHAGGGDTWVNSEETIVKHVDENGDIKKSKTFRFKSNQNEIHETRVYESALIDSLGSDGNITLSLSGDDSVIVDIQKVALKSAKLNIVVKEMLEFEGNLETRIHPHVIDSLLTEEFNDKGIHISYGFGVFDAKKDKFVIAKFSNEEDLKNSPLKATLFPNDLLNSANYLTVNFPKQDQFLIKKVWATLASSILLIGIIVFSFVYAIRIILRQKKLSEIKNDFINNMTHEFKTPIATVSLACEALYEDEIAGNPKTYQRYLKVIGEENKRLEKQVEKVLSAAQLDKQDFKLEQQKTNIVELLEEVTNNFKFRIEELNGTLTLNVETDFVEVWVDRMHTKNVCQNLLDNAIKYSGEAPQIHMRLYFDKGFIKIEVKDQGDGIRKEDQKNIFDKFYRVPTGNVHNIKGFGLGLSYVKSIMDQHKGKITLRSEPGRGSSFTLSFPIRSISDD